ncbi:PAS domain S-box protein [Syntrophomonas curvata]
MQRNNNIHFIAVHTLLSEEKYRLIAENTQDMIAVVDPETLLFKYVSPANIKTIGYSEDEFLARSCLDSIHPEDRDYVRMRLLTGVRYQVGGNVEYRCLKKDGSYIWLETSGRIYRSEDGKAEILLVSRDMTERKRTDEALRDSEQRLRRITDNMLDSIVCMNRKGIMDYVSPSHKKIMGYMPEEMVGKTNAELLHPEDYQRCISFIVHLLREGGNGEIEYRARHKEGHYVWLESAGKAVRDSNAKTLEVVFGTRDISARKLAEQELQQQLDYQNSLINDMNEWFCTYDCNYRLTYVNRIAAENIGYSLEELQNMTIFDLVVPEQQEIVRQKAWERQQGGVAGSYEVLVKCKNGQETLLRVKLSPITNHSGINAGLILAEDISEQRRMEKEMTRMAQLYTVGEMAAGIGHEIRNPLTAVRGFLQLLQKSGDFDQYNRYFEIMLEELDRANTIISEFLMLAKNRLIDLRLHNLNQIIETLYPLLQADAIMADKIVILALQRVPDIFLDEKEVRQLVLNLVRNGLEATPAGGKVKIATWRNKKEIILEVADQGEGIAPDIFEKLGTPFYTTKEEGTGLGLAICYGVAARHQAQIEIISSDSGSRFLVRFKMPDTEPAEKSS